ncbi:MAG: hypothetical protein HY812_08060 [Planctomycetes bacterium]|nr:hypothetical protein [Planctomycetota bacterium]
MNRAVALVLGLALAGCAALDGLFVDELAAPADPFARDPFFLDDVLAWPGSRHGTLGPAGQRLFADDLESAPGLRGRFGYVQDCAGLRDLVRFSFAMPGGEVSPSGFTETWHPSFHETSFRLGEVLVRERKFITEDDVAVVILSFANPGTAERRLGVSVASDNATGAAFRRADMVPLDLSVLANRAPLHGQDAPLAPALEVEGIPFLLPDARANGGRSVLGLRGGSQGDPRFELPRALEIPVNRKAARLHFLGQVGEALGPLEEDAIVALYQVFYEDGAPFTHALRFGRNVAPLGQAGGLPQARGRDGRLVLTIPVNPARAVRFVRFETVNAAFAPLLHALTAELPHPAGAASALAARAAWGGVVAEHALLGEIRGADGIARLRIREWNRPALCLEGIIDVAAGGTAELRVAHALAERPGEAAARADRALAAQDPLQKQRVAFHSWFDANCPRWTCGDERLDRLWRYRCFLLRRSLALPARLGSVATPFVVAEARWLADPRYAQNLIRAHLDAADASGGPAQPRGIALAAWELHLVHPDRAFLREVAPALEREVRAVLDRCDADGDSLPETAAAATGALERPGDAAFLYGDARAVQAMFEELQDDAEARAMSVIAEEVRAAALDTLWDDADACFYAVRAEDGAMVRCAELDAFYPFLTGLAPDDFRYARSLNRLLAQDRAWNGPIRPEADSVIACAFAATLQRRANHDLCAEDLRDLLLANAARQFENGAQEGCADCLTSTWIDLVFRCHELVDWPAPETPPATAPPGEAAPRP